MSPEHEEAFFEEGEDPAQAEESSNKEKLNQCKLYGILLEKYAEVLCSWIDAILEEWKLSDKPLKMGVVLNCLPLQFPYQ